MNREKRLVKVAFLKIEQKKNRGNYTFFFAFCTKIGKTNFVI